MTADDIRNSVVINTATSYVRDLINKDADRAKRTLFVDYIRGVQDV